MYIQYVHESRAHLNNYTISVVGNWWYSGGDDFDTNESLIEKV